MINRIGKYVGLEDIDEDNEDEVQGLTGKYYYNTDTNEGTALRDMIYNLFYLDNTNEYDENPINQDQAVKDGKDFDIIREKIADIIDRDLSSILGYEVTIRTSETHTSFDNEDNEGEWIKK